MSLNDRFSITKFCQNKCQPTAYKKVATAGNDPSITTKMRYSQYIRTVKPRRITVEDQDKFKFNTQQLPIYFAFGNTVDRVDANLQVHKL